MSDISSLSGPAAHKPLVLLTDAIKTPPISESARKMTGFLLRQLQRGQKLSMPWSRPMPNIGRRCHELRVVDAQRQKIWRIIYRTDDDAIIIAEVFAKKTRTTPKYAIDTSRERLRKYDDESR